MSNVICCGWSPEAFKVCVGIYQDIIQAIVLTSCTGTE
jgi:hypothetical protein